MAWLKRKKPLQGLMAGIVGGLAASWVMNQVQAGLTAAIQATETEAERQKEQQAAAQAGDDTTQKVAESLTHAVTGHGLSHQAKQIGGPLVHYGFGGLMGGLYGLAAEYHPGVTLGAGSAFGSALFVGADEIGVPAVGLSGWPTLETAGSQAQYWAAHVAYGVTVEAVRRAFRSLV